MKAKLKEGTKITITSPEYNIILDENIVFTDICACDLILYDVDGNKLYSPTNHELSGCGFPEYLFDIIN